MAFEQWSGEQWDIATVLPLTRLRMITKNLIYFLGILLIAHAANLRAEGMPIEVSNFIERRENCDHFRGEMPGDNSERAKEVNRELEKYCQGSDKELSVLRNKYRKQQDVLHALSKFDDCIEGNCGQ